MTTTILSGLVDTSDILADDKVVDMAPQVAMLDPQVSQFTTMLMKVSSAPAHNVKIEWIEDVLLPRRTTVNGSQTSGDTAIEVATNTGAYFKIGNLVRNSRTGEAFYVTNISTDTLTVTRGIGGVSAASMNDGDELVIVSHASAQGGSLPQRKVTLKVLGYNYTQIARSSYGFSESHIATRLYSGGEPAYQRQKALIEHKRSLENTLFFGARSLDTSGSEPVGTCGGLVEYISTNSVTTVQDKDTFDAFMQNALQHGSENKVLFVAPTVARLFSSFLRDAWRPASVDASLWGAKVNALISGAYGDQIPVFVKRDWNDFTVVNGYGGLGFLVDMDYVKYRPLNGRDTKLLTNRQDNDADTQDEEYLTEFSFEVKQEAAHGLFKNVQV